MKFPKCLYIMLAKYRAQLNAATDSYATRNKVAAVSSPTFSQVRYDVIRADKNGYGIAEEIIRMEAVYSLLSMGVRQEDVLYLVDRNRERESVRVLSLLRKGNPGGSA